MKPSHSSDQDKTPARDEKRQEVPPRQQPSDGAPAGSERRGRHRVADDQHSGAGSQSAFSKLMMMERKRAAPLPRKK
jgi:hypothetical protein